MITTAVLSLDPHWLCAAVRTALRVALGVEHVGVHPETP